MIYLLDGNVLLALGHIDHVHHARVDRWLEGLQTGKSDALWLATCAITELSFVRIASCTPGLSGDLNVAQECLRRLKLDRPFTFLGDDIGADRLPDWVKWSKQTTDGHLLELARHHRATLATLDKGIPSALLIPDNSDTVREPTAVYGPSFVQAPATDTESTVGRVIIEPMPQHLEDRYEIEPITGGIRVKARPGEPKITSEDVRRIMEEQDREYDERKAGRIL